MFGPHGQFPLLIKFLDASQDLSIQVHPDPTYAARHPESALKTEAWHILQSDPGSRLILGLKHGVTRESLKQAVADGTMESLTNSVTVEAGQSVFVPSGTVHALGAGILVAEVQTPSDTTFRLFDFNRIDPSTGKVRTLHVEQSLECIQLPPPIAPMPSTAPVSCEFFSFRTLRWPPGEVRKTRRLGLRVCILLHGELRILVDHQNATAVLPGETVLLPASLDSVKFETVSSKEAVWLDVGVAK